MGWNDQIDLYCERLAPGLLGEPANALSNLAFIVAAVSLWWLQRNNRLTLLPLSIRLLAPLVLLVGLFSSLFHTLATRWAGALDTVFILIYCCVFLYAFIRHAWPARSWVAVGVAAAFAVVSYAFPRCFPAGAWNGSLAYLPNLVGLFVITATLTQRRALAARSFALATSIFCISLALRTADIALCPRFPLGTHFIWHILNGLLLWIVSREMLLRRWLPESRITGGSTEVERAGQVSDLRTNTR
jgi:hypothetical protein